VQHSYITTTSAVVQAVSVTIVGDTAYKADENGYAPKQLTIEHVNLPCFNSAQLDIKLASGKNRNATGINCTTADEQGKLICSVIQ
jgi:hypothetical protein